MNTEHIKQIVKGTVLISNHEGCPVVNRMGAAIQCLEVGEKGFRFRRMNITHNEEFFINQQMLESSLWMIAPENSQLRFL